MTDGENSCSDISLPPHPEDEITQPTLRLLRELYGIRDKVEKNLLVTVFVTVNFIKELVLILRYDQS